MLHQKEVSLLEAIHRTPFASQRFLSKNVGLSLGQTNALIKSLASKGDLEIAPNDGRQVKYSITKRGYARWMRYTKVRLSDAFHCVCDVKRTIGKILDEHFVKGVREFVIEGENDALASMVSEVFRETVGNDAKLLWGPAKAEKDRVLLRLDGIDAPTDKGVVHLMHELAKAT